MSFIQSVLYQSYRFHGTFCSARISYVSQKFSHFHFTCDFNDFTPPLPLFHTDYAVQPSPVQFTRVPQSQTVLMGETVTLTCNFTIIELGSSRNYPVPSAVWRLNGTHNFKPVEPTESDIRRGYLHTELVVESIEAQDAGYYECLAVDGKKRKKENQKAGEGRYIASSPRAYLQVVC